MNTYADASVIVALFVPDLFNERAARLIEDRRPTLVLSDFAAAEFASVLESQVRTRELTANAARDAFDAFDAWADVRGARLETTTADVVAAERLLRRLELNLRTPDALNIAIAQRHGAALATFDTRMAAAARALGVEVADA